MKIYLLRHQERESGHTFSVPLTLNGQRLAQTETLDTLTTLGITQIYSSPFYRVLQTVQPFVKLTRNLIKIEYALYEYLNSSLFEQETPIYIPSQEWYSRFFLNPIYHSVVNPDELKMGNEHTADIRDRLKKFLNYLYQKYSSTQEIILIASHKFILEQILKLVNHPAQNLQFQIGQLFQLV